MSNKNDFIKNKPVGYNKPKKVKHKWTYYVALLIFVFWTLGALLGFVSFIQNVSDNKTVAYADSSFSTYTYESNGFTLCGNLPGIYPTDSISMSHGNVSYLFKPSLIVDQNISNNYYFSFAYLPKSSTSFSNKFLPITAQMPFYTSSSTYVDSRYGCTPTYSLGIESYIYTFTLGLNYNFGSTNSIRFDLSNSFDFTQNDFYYKKFTSNTNCYVARINSSIYSGDTQYYFNYDIVLDFSGFIQYNDFKYFSYYTAHYDSLSTFYPNYDTNFFTNSNTRYSTVGLYVDYYDQNDHLCVRTYYSTPCFNLGAYNEHSLSYGLMLPFYSNYTLTNYIQPSDTYNYSQGFNDGWDEGISQGYEEGYTTGSNDGYYSGYNAGVKDSNQYSFLALIGAVIDAPIQAFRGLLNFEVFGVDMAGFVLGILSICVIASIIKFIL